MYCVDNVILALAIRFTFIRSNKWAKQHNNVYKSTRLFSIPKLVGFLPPWHLPYASQIIITRNVTGIVTKVVTLFTSHSLEARGSHERRDLILAKLSESPWRPDPDTSRQLQADGDCGEIICTLDGNTAFYFQAAVLPTKECWLEKVCFNHFKCPLHILQTDMGILCCGIYIIPALSISGQRLLHLSIKHNMIPFSPLLEMSLGLNTTWPWLETWWCEVHLSGNPRVMSPVNCQTRSWSTGRKNCKAGLTINKTIFGGVFAGITWKERFQ